MEYDRYVFTAERYPEGYFTMIGVVLDHCIDRNGVIGYPLYVDRDNSRVICRIPWKNALAIKDIADSMGIKVTMARC